MTSNDRPEIVSEAFGDRADPALLLIMGAMASMLWWPEAFCRKLADAGLYVIRYDNRDTGRSTKYPVGQPPYTFDDMADDAIAVLDSHGIGNAHVAGMSMGGMIAQLVALRHPSRVASLTVISSSPLGTDTSHLPQTTDAYMEHSAYGAKVDWADRRQVIDFMVSDARAIASTAHLFDETGMRAFIERDYTRSGGLLSATNHFMLNGNDRWKGRLHELAAPLLVIHGTSDPIFPVEHGEALAQAVAGAKLIRVEGGGHELHPDDWPDFEAAIIEHVRSS
ncbi:MULTISPECIES: alpha/beta hydrolase [unclassified Mesorhizobium]|uniref:alpha/beta fold hydrolase n=1 Tax=Mesorhizobium TaxID=68287 RepID=UPI0003CF4A13|nr:MULTISPECIES: alpha/beta hydrolase [unclassified Mesorhizobium]ESY90940.1 acetyltransferase [Mesorhizobium sp. LNHC229A00]ESY92642.1 acetyltransferase [Mesorhizobium sp. LNHC209A00]